MLPIHKRVDPWLCRALQDLPSLMGGTGCLFVGSKLFSSLWWVLQLCRGVLLIVASGKVAGVDGGEVLISKIVSMLC